MATDTLQVLQSCAPGTRPHWLQGCLDSVQGWCAQHGHGYRLLGDELFDFVAPELRDKTAAQPVITTDLARLELLARTLEDGASAALWLDADFLILDPLRFQPRPEDHAVGREIWVQPDARGRLKVYRQVHNAFLLFRRGNAFLDFYRQVAERLLRDNRGGMPPQFIGPKLLTALHNIVQFPVQEDAGALSPAVIHNLLGAGGTALQRLRAAITAPLRGANLCRSSVGREDVNDRQMDQLVSQLLAHGPIET